MQHNESALPSRVCDRCIRKKVRCNQARPTCSRCSELGETCGYTFVRRKPGPLRGSHRASTAGSGRTRLRHNRACLRSGDSSSFRDEDISGGEYPPSQNEHPAHNTSITTPLPDHLHDLGENISQFARHQRFTPQQVEFLLASYFDNLQDANPIFSRETFFQRYRNSLCSDDLISAIVIITANLTGYTAGHEDQRRLDAELDLLLSLSLLEDDLVGDSPSLDQFRKAFILAFYEFHQFPGHHAWLRIGRVTRMAYRIGLDRLDHIRALYPDWGAVSNEDIQEWRWIWWCIYRLDCYSNLSSGMPYLIDDACIKTSFAQCRSTLRSEITEELPQEFLLAPTPENLSRILLSIPLHPETLPGNIHTVTTATMRQAGQITRMHLVRSKQATLTEVAKAEQLLATIRAALPPGWLNTRRSAFTNEPHIDYHARMVTILHLRMAQLLLSIVGCGQRRGPEEWLIGWERILEPCQDIASVVEHWDSSFCLTVDPAVCFTLFTALVFLDLHRKTATTGTASMTTQNGTNTSVIDHHITILRLQLEHFARIWTLPRLLKLSFESFNQSVSGPLSHRQIAMILSHFEAPLHPRWLHFLSTAHTVLTSSE
ncbi:hypothetical protein BJX64DRAFT_251006 [Aspergillus heterothallicus]